MTDIDGDNVLDVILGNFRGGLSFYQTDLNIDGTVDAEALSDIPAFQLVPNPASDYVELQIENFAGQLYEVVIYDILGRVMYQRPFNGENLRIDTENFGSGIYFCKIFFADKKVVKKLIVS